jgi:hypothetical protein
MWTSAKPEPKFKNYNNFILIFLGKFQQKADKIFLKYKKNNFYK